MRFSGYGDLAEALALCFAVLGALLVLLPLINAFCAAREFAMRPDHLVTPTNRWEFFDLVFYRRLRKWAVWWAVFLLLNILLMGIVDWIGHPVLDLQTATKIKASAGTQNSMSGYITEPQRVYHAAYIAIQCGALSLMCMLLAIAVCLLGMLVNPSYGLFVCSTIILTMALVVAIISFLQLPPPTKDMASFIAAPDRPIMQKVFVLDWRYPKTAFFGLFLACGSCVTFFALRDTYLLLDEDDYKKG